MNIVNLTPHNINIHNEDGEQVMVIGPSGSIAKIAIERKKVKTILGFPVFNSTPSGPEGLPPEKPDTIYIVSGMFRSHVQRPDLYQPGELLRDGEGQPIGCTGLSQ
jgi:hypothetical protein